MFKYVRNVRTLDLTLRHFKPTCVRHGGGGIGASVIVRKAFPNPTPYTLNPSTGGYWRDRPQGVHWGPGLPWSSRRCWRSRHQWYCPSSLPSHAHMQQPHTHGNTLDTRQPHTLYKDNCTHCIKQPHTRLRTKFCTSTWTRSSLNSHSYSSCTNAGADGLPGPVGDNSPEGPPGNPNCHTSLAPIITSHLMNNDTTSTLCVYIQPMRCGKRIESQGL